MLLFEENFSIWYLYVRSHFLSICKSQVHPFHRNIVFYVETSHVFLCHIETSSMICRANQWTGFYMIGNQVTGFCMKHNTGLKRFKHSKFVSWKIDILPTAQGWHKRSPLIKYWDVRKSFYCISCKETCCKKCIYIFSERNIFPFLWQIYQILKGGIMSIILIFWPWLMSKWALVFWINFNTINSFIFLPRISYMVY